MERENEMISRNDVFMKIMRTMFLYFVKSFYVFIFLNLYLILLVKMVIVT
jgi:hypothetical protein